MIILGWKLLFDCMLMPCSSCANEKFMSLDKVYTHVRFKVKCSYLIFVMKQKGYVGNELRFMLEAKELEDLC